VLPQKIPDKLLITITLLALPFGVLIAISAYFYLQAAELPNYIAWLANQNSAAPISPPSGGIVEVFQYHGSVLYFQWTRYQQLLSFGGTFVSLGIVLGIALTLSLLPSLKSFKALSKKLSSIPRAPAAFVLAISALALNMNFLWTAGFHHLRPISNLVVYVFHNNLFDVDYESFALFIAAIFGIVVLASNKYNNNPWVVMLRSLQFTALLVLPWGLDVLAFDGGQLLLYATEFQRFSYLFLWFNNSDVLIASLVLFAFTAVTLWYMTGS
jgi:hypothetical protein